LTKERTYKYIDSEHYSLDLRSCSDHYIFVFAPGQGCSIDTEDIPEVIHEILKVAGFSGTKMGEILNQILDRIEIEDETIRPI
jgi:hypothetical protein